MTEHKKIIYQLEDTFALGKSLPVVAMRQLPKIAERLNALEDHPDYMPDTAKVIAKSVVEFYNKNMEIIDDERELKEVFTKACKSKFYSHHYLNLFAEVKKILY